MKSPAYIWPSIALTVMFSGLNIQAAPFVNLTFEAARISVPVNPPGQYGTNEPVAKALFGWSAFIGVHPQTEILHNNATLGDPCVALWGPSNFTASIIGGQFTVVLIAGSSERAPADDVGASISQTAVVPTNAVSVLFKTRSAPPTFGLFADGNSLSLVPVFVSGQYTQYGADISAYAGQNTELKFTAFFVLGTFNGMLLDDISFSPNPIPEPSSLALLALAGFLLLVLQHCRRAIQSR